MSPATTSRELRLAIGGMTCAACEARIIAALSAIPGVASVRASARTGTATLRLSGEVPGPDLARAIEQAGYALLPAPAASPAQPGRPKRPWLSRDPGVWRDVAAGATIVTLLAVLLAATGILPKVTSLTQRATGGSLLLVLALGVAASLSTCMALTGGLVVSLSARYGAAHPQASRAQRVIPQLTFNAGRVAGFAALGALLGAAGSLVRFTPAMTAGAMILAALVMGVLGLSLTGISPRLAALTLHLPGRAGTRAATVAAGGDDEARPYRSWHAAGWGAATFFLPCGFTQAVQVYAASTGSPARAAAIMGLFALGTVPALLAAGSLAALATGPRARLIYRLLGVVVLAFALVNLTGAARTFAPAAGLVNKAASAQAPASGPSGAGGTPGADGRGLPEPGPNVSIEDGVQVARTALTADGYEPQVTTIYEKIPVRWIMRADVINCGLSIDATPFGGQVWQLRPDQDNAFEFTASSAGELRYSCTMGMIHGSFHVIALPR